MYQLTMTIKVNSVSDLYDAAFARALKDGESVPSALQLLGHPDDPQIGDCLVMLIDPGTLEGCSIEQTEVTVETDRSAWAGGGDVNEERIGGYFIEWYVWGDGADNVGPHLDDASREYIHNLLLNDFRDGELAFSDVEGKNGDNVSVRGYWRIGQ